MKQLPTIQKHKLIDMLQEAEENENSQNPVSTTRKQFLGFQNKEKVEELVYLETILSQINLEYHY